MLASLLAIAVFAALAAVVVRWAQVDYDEDGRLTVRSTVGGWLLYFFHADSVATAAYAGALRVDAIPPSVGWATGTAVALVGIVVFISAVSRLSRVHEDGGLQTTGVFGAMRHPQNFGWGLLLLGIALMGRSVLALALVALFAVFVDRYTRVEEAHLERRFGEEWCLYRARTPAVPVLRRRQRA